ncbi:hypothetical protein BL250_14925 [Erwinia sp. OLTSP20]|nr:hypothetical protein BV501_17685 [Erwinia sp. OAMSP11]PIJ68876.1 hypothetical protein BK416_15950 [Erwinia sp. OLSSP12]PIJ80096.1 hypothetical protein BLD46_16135 [Erwinia sp. OLMTSP26]PIJ81533.1 hypothetical protein BLD49_16350 [Erwinia sp. OLMDSP33]PIJ82701.1 hypothetical protein BLD47_06260 [Erwinia sp. OLCASP19]PIJ89907.1 hypothetical protein BL250_14925 [Erwinia sp. OLTSP20]PIJ89956.1 hypothetical protein BL249_14520 [Erwinia sp. OLFS4]
MNACYLTKKHVIPLLIILLNHFATLLFANILAYLFFVFIRNKVNGGVFMPQYQYGQLKYFREQ